MHYPTTPHHNGSGPSRLFPFKQKKTYVSPIIAERLPEANRFPNYGQYFFTAQTNPMTNIVPTYQSQQMSTFMSPMMTMQQPLPFTMPELPQMMPQSVGDLLPTVETFDAAAYDTITSSSNPMTNQSTPTLTSQFDDVSLIGVYVKQAKRLAKSHEPAFVIEQLPYGCERVLYGKHGYAFALLRNAPSLAEVQRLLPHKNIHPYADCLLRSLEDQEWRYHLPEDYMPDSRYAAQHFNDWLEAYRRKLASTEMKELVAHWEATTNDLYKGAVTYLNSLFDYARARLLVLRIDLGVRVEHQDSLHVFQMRDDFQRMLKNTEMNSLFDNMVGYIWRLEYTEDKSYHYHCIFLLDGSEEQYDAELADKIGKYWVNSITDEKGTYWNCNASYNHYKRRGIGMIDYRDTEKRQSLIRDVLPYLTVVDNDLRLHITEDAKALGYEGDVKVRTFGRGTIRTEKKTNRGRPRQAGGDNWYDSVPDDIVRAVVE